MVVVLAVVGCGNAATSPYQLSQPERTTPTYFVASPSPTPTPLPAPTWTTTEKATACGAVSSTAAAEAEVTSAYSDAEAGRWTKTAAHLRTADSEMQTAITDIDALQTSDLPSVGGDQITRLSLAAGSYALSIEEMAWGIEREGARDAHAVDELNYSLTVDLDLKGLVAIFGDC